ncbi:MAG: T9SS type A sorting domain-containing protein [Saprospiraceae bacterium]|nr:T9SS type A sorting domain-containing protein [Saprospiraceae bacterium]
MKRTSLLLAFLAITFFSLRAQVPKPFLLKNINTIGSSQWQWSQPTNFTLFKDQIFFGASDGDYRGFWKTDGTTGGTVRVSDVQAHVGSSLAPFPVIGDKLFFAGFNQHNGEHGIWVSDGTVNGTYLVKSFGTSTWPDFENLTVFGDKLLFAATDQNGRALWVSDGTPDGTIPLQYFAPSTTFELTPNELTIVGDKVYFIGHKTDSQIVLWVTDGTPDGTISLRVFTGTSSPKLSDFTAYNGKAIFSVVFPDNINYLYVSDGTVNGTKKLADFQTAYTTPNPIAHYKNEVYFAGIDQNGKWGLWKTNGTEAGTHPITEEPWFRPTNFLVKDNWLYFLKNGQLWRTDGTAQNTTLLDSIEYSSGYADQPLTIFNDNIYFDALYYDENGMPTSRQLWATNGEPGDLHLFKQLTQNGDADPTSFYEHGGKLYFWAMKDNEFGGTFGPVLWATDGSPDNTAPITNLFWGDRSRFVPVSDLLYVLAYENSGDATTSLFFTDGTNVGTLLMVPDDADTLGVELETGYAVLNRSLIFGNRFSGAIGNEPYIITPDGVSDAAPLTQPASRLLAYPNPSHGTVNFVLRNTANPVSLRIFHQNGQLLNQLELDRHQTEFPVVFPANGIYFAAFQLEDGSVMTEKVVIREF